MTSTVSCAVVEIGFNQSSYQTTEMAGSVAVCAKLISGVLGVDVMVDVSTSSGTGCVFLINLYSRAFV